MLLFTDVSYKRGGREAEPAVTSTSMNPGCCQGHKGTPLPWSSPHRQTESHALPFLAGWEGSVGTTCSPTVPPWFFLSKQACAQPNQILFFYSMLQELFAPERAA